MTSEIIGTPVGFKDLENLTIPKLKSLEDSRVKKDFKNFEFSEKWKVVNLQQITISQEEML